MSIELNGLPGEPCPHCGGSGQVYDDGAVGELVRTNRELRRVSLRKVAERMGYSPSYLSDLELGRRRWSAGLLDRYKKAVEES